MRIDLGNKTHHSEEAQQNIDKRQDDADKRHMNTEHKLESVTTKRDDIANSVES